MQQYIHAAGPRNSHSHPYASAYVQGQNGNIQMREQCGRNEERRNQAGGK